MMVVGLVFKLHYMYNISIMKNLKKIIFIAYFFILPVVSFADGTNDPTQGKIIDPLNNKFRFNSCFYSNYSEGAITLGIPVIALAVVYCGFLFVAARGNSEKLTKAKSALTWTLVGAAILLGALAIAKMIAATVVGLGS